MSWQTLADAVLLLHAAVVLFIVGGLVAIVVGNRRGWVWVNRRTFRWLHLAGIAIVVSQAWLGQHCPLTVLESWLRVQAGQTPYQTSFIQTWVARLLYHDLPLPVFALIYTGFAGLVALAWWRYPPQRRG